MVVEEEPPEVVVEEDPPEVVVEEDLPPEVVMEEDPLEVVVEEDPPEVVMFSHIFVCQSIKLWGGGPHVDFANDALRHSIAV